jgi:NADPH:quinone reductase
VRAVLAPTPGGPEALVLTDRPDPRPGPGDLLVDVEATAVNRADLLQRRGLYPPPPGATDVLGLELAGRVAAVGPDVIGWAVGDPVCAVVAGGGYATRAVVPAATAMPLPPGLDALTAAAVPEVFATAYDALVLQGRLAAGEVALLHGGSSGVGTAAIQLVRRAGAVAAVTVGTPAKAAACRDLGAAVAIDRRAEPDFDLALRRELGRGADVLLDIVGGGYLARNLRALETGGRMVVLGLMGGAAAELDLALLMRRRLTVRGSTLRARPVQEKAALAARLVADVWPGFADGSLRPVVHEVLPLARIADAHRLVEAGSHVGKVVVDCR